MISEYVKEDQYDHLNNHLTHSCVGNGGKQKGILRKRLHELQKNNVTSQSQDSYCENDKNLYIELEKEKKLRIDLEKSYKQLLT